MFGRGTGRFGFRLLENSDFVLVGLAFSVVRLADILASGGPLARGVDLDSIPFLLD